MPLSTRQQIQVKLGADHLLAHRYLFAHRHTNEEPPFRARMIGDWHSSKQYLCELAFRGSTKSTTAEEGLCIDALYQRFKFCIIFGASLPLAQQRVHSIRREFEKNKRILQIWGDMRGPIWSDTRIELSNGVVIQAMGRGQAMRGSKEEDTRPDFMVFDDIEDREELAKEELREKIQSWVFGDAIPAMDDPKLRRVRMLCNALHEECLGMRLKVAEEKGVGDFEVHTTPIEHIDENGERVSSWPDRYPLSFVDRERERMYSLGRGIEFEAEYLCNPISPQSRPFRKAMFKTIPRARTWEAVYAMFDPARTVGAKAANTGFAAWSWIGGKLVVWEGWGKQLMPDGIVSEMFAAQRELHPVHMGFEEDGLNLWALQPIRNEMVRRGEVMSLRPVKAPNNKTDFIRGLQHYANVGLIEFAKDLPELVTSLINFPTGRIDAANALAYALKMRPGAPVYETFSAKHVSDTISPIEGRPVWLCLNATRGLLSGAAVQVIDGSLRVFADVVREGDPATHLGRAVQDIQLELGCPVRLVCGPEHFDRYNNVGLVQAAARIPQEARAGTASVAGRGVLNDLLERDRGQNAMIMVAASAPWTLNALAGGYARVLKPNGMYSAETEQGIYKVLVEGLESFVGLMAMGSTDGDRYDSFNAVTPQGRRYRSILGGDVEVRELKR